MKHKWVHSQTSSQLHVVSLAQHWIEKPQVSSTNTLEVDLITLLQKICCYIPGKPMIPTLEISSISCCSWKPYWKGSERSYCKISSLLLMIHWKGKNLTQTTFIWVYPQQVSIVEYLQMKFTSDTNNLDLFDFLSGYFCLFVPKFLEVTGTYEWYFFIIWMHSGGYNMRR